MIITARNQLKGTVVSVAHGPVTSLVKIDLGTGHHVTASVTTEAIDELHISEGVAVTAIFKASSVMLGVD